MNKRIALTGATGFVGGHLLQALVSLGYKVNALTRRPQQAQENVTWINGDFENNAALEDLIRNADVIINVAGLVKARNRQEFYNANGIAVSALLEAMKTRDIKPHFIQISTIAAREPHISDYAASKYEGEKYLINNDQSINWTIIRPPGIYGPGDSETLKIFKLLKWHLALYPGNSENRVSWIHVDDLVRSISLLIDNEQYFGKSLEIDDGRENGYSHKEFFETIARHLHIKPLKITVPKFLLKMIGHINDISGHIFGYAPMMSAKKVNELCHSNWVCKKNDDFPIEGWQAEFDLETGLKETLDWYKKNEYI